ncbi:MAG: hypothetical protein OXI15_12310 [Chromatiales bacterium]|nr:hypothetical protein [Chromatiales bacterium]
MRHGSKVCQSIRAEAVDAAVAHWTVAAMNRESIELALAVQEQVRTEFAMADEQRTLRIERLGYRAELARRRYFAVDPENRLVAAPLEAEWNERLRELEEAMRERQARREARDEELSAERIRRAEELAADFAQVWDAPATENVDRKRLLRLLVEDVTLTRDGYEADVGLRLRGGKTQALEPVLVPLNPPRKVKHPLHPEIVAALDTHSDAEAVEILNRAGHRLWDGRPFTLRHVYRLRQRVGMKGHLARRQERLRAEGWSTAGELAEQLGVSAYIVRSRTRQGRILCAEIRSGKKRNAMYRLPPSGEEGSKDNDERRPERTGSKAPSEARRTSGNSGSRSASGQDARASGKDAS